MLRRIEVDVDVVTMARRRIRNVFSNGVPVYLSVSGGKDSICLNELVFRMCESGEVDRSLLTVDFVDEEAIYPCVERVVQTMRRRWMMLGVEFRWWCCEFKHYNCFNALTNDESFITWDRHAEWVRPRPSHAITSHQWLKPRKDTYQEFLKRLNRNGIQMNGLRVSESLQRLKSIAYQRTQRRFAYPIYDWKDSDIWRFIADNGLDMPDAYMFMYQTGRPRNRMRISQFFSVDTASSLVQMCEYYPDLFNRICKREPNAYMAMLYYDTELFRRSRKSKEDEIPVDYKANVLERLADTKRSRTPSMASTELACKKLLFRHASIMQPQHWKTMNDILVGGDPKHRAVRSLINAIARDNAGKEVPKRGHSQTDNERSGRQA